MEGYYLQCFIQKSVLILLSRCIFFPTFHSWTSKFKHVVGIVHTNYFVYAMEQPAAYLRVSFHLFFLISLKYFIQSSFTHTPWNRHRECACLLRGCAEHIVIE